MDYIIDVTTYILSGCSVTLKLFAVTLIFSIPIGILSAAGRISGRKILKPVIHMYTWFFRGTPLLLQVFVTYFGLPVIGIKLSPFIAASVAFILNYGAYFTEIFRAGIESIDKGQYEASKALGMNYIQMMTRIILPQAAKRVLPPTCNEAINLIKDTALVATIGMGDLLRAAKEAVTRDFTISPFIIAAIVYLALTSVIVISFRSLERRYSFFE